ncbi:hypothetical protein PVK06_005572 [Gossypium arboreum]|uniref:Uncharacterized protein n=1 Tax=Gossypium arboreum TaxID=29729 RepID=A0ABR0QUY1_GOSAR|nr:hypothetical protein PVK06_005572 [Gossypium arboreum]
MDGPTVTMLVVVPDKEDLCEAFLRKVSNKFPSGQIGMRWLENNFKELPNYTPDFVKEQYA